MNKSIKLMLLLMAVSAPGPMVSSEAWSAETYYASLSGQRYRGSLPTHRASDPCVQSFDQGHLGPCEHFYSPRVSVDPNVRSTTTGPYYDNNCNELRSRKLMRGVANVTLAVGEIPAGAFREAYATSPVTGAVVGGFHGALVAVQRIGIGLFEIVTFPLPLNQQRTGESVLPPDFPGVEPIQGTGHVFDHTCFGSWESTDGCCYRTRGTFAPYIEPEVVWMDALPPWDGN
jgi:putative exosortase-associated protein (TIGR04073 family)